MTPEVAARWRAMDERLYQRDLREAAKWQASASNPRYSVVLRRDFQKRADAYRASADRYRLAQERTA